MYFTINLLEPALPGLLEPGFIYLDLFVVSFFLLSDNNLHSVFPFCWHHSLASLLILSAHCIIWSRIFILVHFIQNDSFALTSLSRQ